MLAGTHQAAAEARLHALAGVAVTLTPGRGGKEGQVVMSGR